MSYIGGMLLTQMSEEVGLKYIAISIKVAREQSGKVEYELEMLAGNFKLLIRLQ